MYNSKQFDRRLPESTALRRRIIIGEERDMRVNLVSVKYYKNAHRLRSKHVKTVTNDHCGKFLQPLLQLLFF